MNNETTVCMIRSPEPGAGFPDIGLAARESRDESHSIDQSHFLQELEPTRDDPPDKLRAGELSKRDKRQPARFHLSPPHHEKEDRGHELEDCRPGRIRLTEALNYKANRSALRLIIK